MNILLLVFDLLLLPITLIRMGLIYYYGSKYDIMGFKFLDVIMHADRKYFNQDNQLDINTMDEDYRVVIREDTRFYATDINKYCELKPNNNIKKTIDIDKIMGDVIIGETVKQVNQSEVDLMDHLSVGTLNDNAPPIKKQKPGKPYNNKRRAIVFEDSTTVSQTDNHIDDALDELMEAMAE